jgi:hypothetical protein
LNKVLLSVLLSVLTVSSQPAQDVGELDARRNRVNTAAMLALGLAGAGLYGSRRAEPSPDLFTAIDRQYSLEKTLLFNAGLDAAYIMTGVFLLERSRTATSQAERLQGYGQSLLVQGGVLLGFDLVVYLIQRRSRKLLRQALS